MYNLFSEESRSDLIIIVVLSLAFLLFIFRILNQGFNFNDLLNSVIVLLVIAYFIARSFLKETPLIESKYGVYLLGFIVLGLGGLYALIKILGSHYALFFLLGVGIISMFLLERYLDSQKKQSYKSQSQKSPRPEQKIRTNDVSSYSNVVQKIYYSIYYALTFSKRQREEKELKELNKKGQVKREILENLGWWDFNNSMLSNNQLGEMSDDEFNNLIKNFNERKEKEIQLKQSLIFKVIESIENFKPAKKWHNEDSYHKELLGWLKQPFPEIKYELQTGGSRPDLVIGKIAIEIKGPTDDNALNTLATKILKYSHYYEHVVFVLFEPSFSERNYKEITSGIKNTYLHVHVIRK
jgi:hypothetical protein